MSHALSNPTEDDEEKETDPEDTVNEALTKRKMAPLARSKDNSALR